MSAVARHGAQEFPEPVEAVGQIRFGGQVAVDRDPQIRFRYRIGHFVQHLLERAPRPRVSVVPLLETLVPLRQRKDRRRLPTEIFNRPQGSIPAALADLDIVEHERAIQNDRVAAGRRGVQPELSHQIPQRIVADGFVVVTLGHARLVLHRCGIKSAGSDLAPETVARLE